MNRKNKEIKSRSLGHESLYIPPPNPPAVIQIYREKMKDVPTDKLTSLYYEYMTKIQDKKLSKNERLMYCSLSFALLESLIKNNLEDYGRFDIQKIPALEFAIDEFMTQGVNDQLLNIKAIVEYFPELRPWKVYLQKRLSIE